MLAGCGTAREFLVERALDFTDIVDVQVASAVGLGAEVEATDYLGTGLGWGYAEVLESWDPGSRAPGGPGAAAASVAHLVRIESSP